MHIIIMAKNTLIEQSALGPAVIYTSSACMLALDIPQTHHHSNHLHNTPSILAT